MSTRKSKRQGDPAAVGARRMAYETLSVVMSGRATARAAIDERLRAAGEELSEADRGFIAELVNGTLRRGLTYDRYIDHVTHRPEQLAPELRLLLRLGAHQALTLRTPAHAAVNTTVELAHVLGMNRAATLVNAVMRRIANPDDAPPAPPREKEPAAYLAFRYALPEWMAALFVQWHGLDGAEQLAAALLETPELCVRVNLLKTDRDEMMRRWRAAGIECEAGVLSPAAVRFAELSKPWLLPGFDEGLFSVQDEAAQLVAPALAPAAGQNILDACAAPGGKTTHLAELAADRARVLALDVSRDRLTLLEENTKRLGLSSISTRAADAIEFAGGTEARFDGVLLDAPCSGLGVLRRHPESRYHLTPQALAELAKRQAHMLSTLARLVADGGVLVYAVCSIAPEEGADHIRRFVEGYSEFTVDPPLPADDALWRRETAGKPGLTLWPHRHHTDGFFIARLRKRRRN